MGTGFLEVVATAALGAMPIAGARVVIFSGESALYELFTDESGTTETVPLDAPPREITLDPNHGGIPYFVFNVRAEMDGFASVTVHDVKILDGETSILPVLMTPAIEPGEPLEIWTPPHNLAPLPPMTSSVRSAGLQ